MKLKVLACILFLVVQASAQSGSSNDNSNWFSWFLPAAFTRPQAQPAAESPVSSLTSQADRFEDPLPKDETNIMIYDSISQNVLHDASEQSKVQPEAVPIDAEVTMADQPMADQPTRKRNIPIQEALRIVQTSGLSDCVRRVICELSCNSNAFGVQGRKVFKNLIKLQMNKSIQEDTSSFKTASQKGMQFKQTKVNCSRCLSAFPDCKSQSSDLVAVSAMFEV